MPWPRSRTAHTSIRGHISAPIPTLAPDHDDVTNHPRESDAVHVSRNQVLRSDHVQGDAAATRPEHAAPAPEPQRASLGGQTDGPQRKKTVIKSALSRFLGRGMRASHAHISPSELPTPHQPDVGGAQDLLGPWPFPYHSQQVPPEPVEQKRYASMPITEYDRALRSHSIGPRDVLAIQSARNSLNADARQSARGPDASDATLTLPTAPRWTEARRFTGLTPRPASSQQRRPRLADWNEDPDEIGGSIASDLKGLRRRSRSMSACPTADGAVFRGDEMRSWRESCEPPAVNSPLPALHQVDAVDTPAVDEHEAATVDRDRPKSPARPFMIGDVDFLKATAGLNITDAASLDSRISTLEMRTSRPERLIGHRVQPGPALASRTASQSSRIPASGPAAQADAAACQRSVSDVEQPKMAFGDEVPVSLDNTPRSTMLLSQSTNSSASRPLSLATVRGAFGSSSLPQRKAGTVTVDHLMTLVNLLETERSARKLLESEVKRLGHQVHLATKLAGYPCPPMGEFPSVDGSLGGTSAFEYGDEEETCWAKKGAHEPSRTTTGLEGKGDDEDADSYAESYATPDEDHDVSSSNDEHDSGSKTRNRALSLSRLTLGSSPTYQTTPRAI